MRRDAELNLERILTAAHDVFAEGGFESSMDQVATRAGVGVGTLYRRFPEKERLVAAVVELAGARARALADELAEVCAPEEGIFEFMRHCVLTSPNVRALIARSPGLGEVHRTMLDLVAPSVERLLARAKASGAVRRDVTFGDVVVIMMSLRSVADRCGAVGAAQAERHLQLLMDGLRCGGMRLPHRPLTRVQLQEMLLSS